MSATGSGAAGTDSWQPDQYARFAAERRQPFDELVGLCRPAGGGVVYDLGCGTGVLTAELPARLDAGLVVGQDTSEAMLAQAPTAERARFEVGDLRQFTPAEPPAIIFSNAALHWVDDHAGVLGHWRDRLVPGGQIAVQVPTNTDHPAYALASNLATELADWFPHGPPELPTMTVAAPEYYAQVLHDLGATETYVALRVFTHLLDSTAEVTEWIKGTALNPFRTALGDERFADFERAYTERLIAEQGDRRPYLFTFKRILMWAQFD